MIILVLIVGLALGSFVNALVWRVHEQELAREKVKGHKEKRSRFLSPFFRHLSTGQNRYAILTGRSMCPKCKHELAARDLVPVFSWLWLRGKCRYCGKPISPQYPLVELLTVGLFVVSYVWWPVPFHGFGLFEFILWLAFLTGFMALAVYDLHWQLLPTRILRPLIGLALIQVVVLSLLFSGGWRTLVSAGLGVLILAGIFYVLFVGSKGKWIGGGDVRLGVLLGLLVGGPGTSFLLLFLASVAGTLCSLPLLTTHRLRRDSHIPFGPFLLLAAVVVRLFGMSILHWYTQTLLGG